MVSADGVEWTREGDEVARYELRSLVDQLVEGVLAVGAGLSEVNRPRLVIDIHAVERDALAVALHGQLLQIGGKPFEVLVIGEDRHCLRPVKVIVPDREEPHQYGHIALEGGGAEVLVHLVETVQQGAEAVRADGEHGRKADRRIHGVASANPVPEPEHILGIDPEPRYRFAIRRDRDEVPGHGLDIAAEARETPVPGASGVCHRFQGREGFG